MNEVIFSPSIFTETLFQGFAPLLYGLTSIVIIGSITTLLMVIISISYSGKGQK